MTIAHSGVRVPAAQHQTVVAWYEAALAPLGYKRAIAVLDGQVVGLADASGVPDWWVTSTAVAPLGVPAPESAAGAAVMPIHTAFAAKDRATVDAFHKAAVAAGGKCNGTPGVREQYAPTYYGAYVLDPAGNNIEAVCMAAE